MSRETTQMPQAVRQTVRRTASDEETEQLGSKLGAALKAPVVLALVGDLGAGKTCFVRGLATGLGLDPGDVTSPSFVYMNEYPEARIPFVHADLYRFADMDEDAACEALEAIGLIDLVEGGWVAAIEWWDLYRGPRPSALIRVEFTIENPDNRSIKLEFLTSQLGHVADAVGA